MISLGTIDANRARAQGTGCPGQIVRRRQGSTGNFEQNVCGTRQRAADGYQGTACADVESGGELKEVFALVVSTTHEDGNGKWESSPLSSFLFEPTPDQEQPLEADNYPFYMASIGPNSEVVGGNADFQAQEPSGNCGNRASCA
jgi:hypothetical protein